MSILISFIGKPGGASRKGDKSPVSVVCLSMGKHCKPSVTQCEGYFI